MRRYQAVQEVTGTWSVVDGLTGVSIAGLDETAAESMAGLLNRAFGRRA